MLRFVAFVDVKDIAITNVYFQLLHAIFSFVALVPNAIKVQDVDDFTGRTTA
jgi:hypothetical protein